MAMPNLKTFVIAVCKPLIFSLRMFYDNQVKYMFQRITKQDEIIRSTQSSVAEYAESINTLCKAVIGYQDEMKDLKSKLYSAEEVRQLERRCRELDYISGQLYDKLYEFMNTGSIKDPTLPDFNNPHLPGDPVTDAYLEQLWRKENGIPLGVPLTSAQQIELQKYIDQYRAENPSVFG